MLKRVAMCKYEISEIQPSSVFTNLDEQSSFHFLKNLLWIQSSPRIPLKIVILLYNNRRKSIPAANLSSMSQATKMFLY